MRTQTRRRLTVPAVLSLAALLAILPMLVRGPSCGHDFDFHLLSWLEAADQFAHFGYPHWAFTPAWNAGEPRFVFYPPLSWALGAMLGLVMPWSLVPAAFTWVALTLSGLTMYRLASHYSSPDAALLAATLYLANPYMLFTAYERTAYGELLAAAWLPLLFAAALAPERSVAGAGRLSPALRIALPVALLWLTNAPAAVMSCYALACLTVVRLCMVRASRLRLAANTLAGTALGLALASFYVVPAAYEQRFVQVNMAVIPGMRPQEHFLFHRMGSNSFDDLFHDQVVRTASIVALMLLAGIAIALLLSLKKPGEIPGSAPSQSYRDGWDLPRIPLALLTFLIAFLLTPPSLFLWNHVPKLAFLQFPWRLTALLGVILALAAALAARRIRSAGLYALLPLPLALVLVIPAWHLFRQPCDPEDTVPARVALFHSNLGTEPTDEYTPKVDDNDALGKADPPYWLLPSECPPGTVAGTSVPTIPPLLPDTGPPPPDTVPGQAPRHLVLDLGQPEYLVLNRRNYPFWQLWLNGKQVDDPLLLGNRGHLPAFLMVRRRVPVRPDGLIVVALPAGHSTVDITFRRTPDQTAGLAISGAAAVAAFGLSRRRWKQRRQREASP